MPAGLNPVGLAFVCILALAFLIGVSATVYCAWIQPCIARQRLRAQLRKRARQHAATLVATPHPNNSALNTPAPPSPEKDLEKGGASIFVHEAETSVESVDALPLPQPAFSFAKKEGRFSTASKDGMWWFV